MLHLATWNVLHRIHAENWGEAPSLAEQDEPARCRAVAARVWGEGWDVVALQEVSGDQLAALRASAPEGAEVLAFTYPRLPRLKVRGVAPVLSEPTEHLVTLVRGAGARVTGGSAFTTDPGKGWLAVELPGGLVVVNTHVTTGERAAGQLEVLAQELRRTPIAVVMGDFNAPRSVVAAALGEGFRFGVAELAMPTRPRRPGAEKSQEIDHIIGWQVAIEALRVSAARGLSDHNPVDARVVRP